ncbi:MAG: hypothetical protein R3C20_16780 [Planctomycetaceae bacterium]
MSPQFKDPSKSLADAANRSDAAVTTPPDSQAAGGRLPQSHSGDRKPIPAMAVAIHIPADSDRWTDTRACLQSFSLCGEIEGKRNVQRHSPAHI